MFYVTTKSLASLTTTESDIFFVCDIDLKINIKTLDRIRMNTGNNKVHGGIYYKTEVKWRRSITCTNMQKKSIIKHSISLRKYLRVFAKSIIKHLNCSKILL